jgi:glycerol-3-phosphate dehydrogenase
LNVFGGKITTYRRLAEAALDELAAVFPGLPGKWTAGVALPGGDFGVDEFDTLVADLNRRFPFLTARWARRLVRAYGTEAQEILGDATTAEDLGEDFGATLTERELRWLVEKEFVTRAQDALWRRSKLGLRMDDSQVARLNKWMKDNLQASVGAAAE